jgi:PAP2 superfamily.
MRSQLRIALVLAIAATAVMPVAGIAQAGSPGVQAADDRHGSSHSRSTAVVDWNATATQAAVTSGMSPDLNPLGESRLYAMLAIATHDALNGIDRRYRPYVHQDLHAQPWASPDAAVSAAARNVLVPGLKELASPLLDRQAVAKAIADVENAYAGALAAIPDGPAKNSGISTGTAAAAAITERRSSDKSDKVLLIDPLYPQGDQPGEWRFTPDRKFAFAPTWGTVTPFVLKDSRQFAPPGPYPVTSRKYARDFNEVKRLGGDAKTRSQRTPDQTQIALFWVGSSPYQWNSIARTLSTKQHLDLWQSARLFGLLNMAMADGYIGSFATKFSINYWRPVTAIREGNADGNPATTANLTWNPLATTPPIPDYDSGHAVEGAVAAAVFRRYFDKDAIDFSVCSITLADPNQRCGGTSQVLRHFSRFSQAAAENGESRILVGYHFRKAVEDGIVHGTKIGDRAVSLFLRRSRS